MLLPSQRSSPAHSLWHRPSHDRIVKASEQQWLRSRHSQPVGPGPMCRYMRVPVNLGPILHGPKGAPMDLDPDVQGLEIACRSGARCVGT